MHLLIWAFCCSVVRCWAVSWVRRSSLDRVKSSIRFVLASDSQFAWASIAASLSTVKSVCTALLVKVLRLIVPPVEAMGVVDKVPPVVESKELDIADTVGPPPPPDPPTRGGCMRFKFALYSVIDTWTDPPPDPELLTPAPTPEPPTGCRGLVENWIFFKSRRIQSVISCAVTIYDAAHPHSSRNFINVKAFMEDSFSFHLPGQRSWISQSSIIIETGGVKVTL